MPRCLHRASDNALVGSVAKVLFCFSLPPDVLAALDACKATGASNCIVQSFNLLYSHQNSRRTVRSSNSIIALSSTRRSRSLRCHSSGTYSDTDHDLSLFVVCQSRANPHPMVVVIGTVPLQHATATSRISRMVQRGGFVEKIPHTGALRYLAYRSASGRDRCCGPPSETKCALASG